MVEVVDSGPFAVKSVASSHNRRPGRVVLGSKTDSACIGRVLDRMRVADLYQLLRIGHHNARRADGSNQKKQRHASDGAERPNNFQSRDAFVKTENRHRNEDNWYGRDYRRRNTCTRALSGEEAQGDAYVGAEKAPRTMGRISVAKKERVRRKTYQTVAQARADLFGYIEVFYNRNCRHALLGRVSPVELENAKMEA